MTIKTLLVSLITFKFLKFKSDLHLLGHLSEHFFDGFKVFSKLDGMSKLMLLHKIVFGLEITYLDLFIGACGFLSSDVIAGDQFS